MPLNQTPLPLDTPLVNKDGTIEFNAWVTYFVGRDALLNSSSTTVVRTSTELTESASIAPTALSVGSTAAMYRLNVYARITQAATTSSSLTPVFRWTESGVDLSRTMAALTGNTTTTLGLDVFPIRIDANTSVTYETTYASSGATAMQYYLEVAVERVN